MIRLSANLGFLWQELSLPDAIRAAKSAGFHAVECHWPYDIPAEDVVSALSDTGMQMLGLNTLRGNPDNGDNGVSAVPGRESEAKQYIDQAIAYATEINCQNIHVMAGVADIASEKAQNTYTENLQHACRTAAQHNKTILIEPLNVYDAPGYYLSTLNDALSTLERVNEPNLKIMFDCYHMQIMGGDLLRRYKNVADSVGHIQFAGVPDRMEPDSSEVNFPWLLNSMLNAGYNGVFGAEYKPRTNTNDGLSWLKQYKTA